MFVLALSLFTAASIAFSRDSREAMSNSNASAWHPSARNSRAMEASAANEREANNVRAPARAMPSAIACPIPRLAPATKAVFPANENGFT